MRACEPFVLTSARFESTLAHISVGSYVVLDDVPKLATSSRRLLTPSFAKTDLR
jgi:hypothetical protein